MDDIHDAVLIVLLNMQHPKDPMKPVCGQKKGQNVSSNPKKMSRSEKGLSTYSIACVKVSPVIKKGNADTEHQSVVMSKLTNHPVS